MPVVDMTTSFAGRRREKEKPVPPPDLWIRAVYFTASKISSMESPTGSTKQAESCPSSRPAFIRVGELGRNSKAGHHGIEFIGKGCGVRFLVEFRVGGAMVSATRRNISTGVFQYFSVLVTFQIPLFQNGQQHFLIGRG